MTAEERRAVVVARDPSKVRAADRARYERDRPKRLAAAAAIAAANPEPSRRAKAAWVERNPDKRRAHVIVNNAVRDGRLFKPEACEECGERPGRRRLHAHHEDYERPLDVRWLCTACHGSVR